MSARRRYPLPAGSDVIRERMTMIRIRGGARRAMPVVDAERTGGARSRPRSLRSARRTTAIAAVLLAALLTTAAMHADSAVDAHQHSAAGASAAPDAHRSGATRLTIRIATSTTIRRDGFDERSNKPVRTDDEFLRLLSIIPATVTSVAELSRQAHLRIGLMHF